MDYATPATRNVNYAWILNIASKLSDNGVSSILLVNRALYGEEQVFLIREQLL